MSAWRSAVLHLCLGLAFAVLTGAATPEAASADAARRIVSLNLCTDELLLRLADRSEIASVTHLAADPGISTVADKATGLALNRGQAEEIIPLKPDLILAGKYTTRFSANLLQQLGYKVMVFDVPHSEEDIYQQIRQVAEAVGHPERGEALVADMRRRLEALTVPPTGLTATVYSPNGFTAGRGSLIDVAFQRAGLANLAIELGIDNYGRLPMELLVVHHPDLIVLNRRDELAPSLATQMTRHPVLRAAFRPDNTVVIPNKLWTCGSPALVDAVALLLEAERKLTGKGAKR